MLQFLPNEIVIIIMDFVYGEPKLLFKNVMSEFKLIKKYFRRGIKMCVFDGRQLLGTVKRHPIIKKRGQRCSRSVLNCEYCNFLQHLLPP